MAFDLTSPYTVGQRSYMYIHAGGPRNEANMDHMHGAFQHPAMDLVIICSFAIVYRHYIPYDHFISCVHF